MLRGFRWLRSVLFLTLITVFALAQQIGLTWLWSWFNSLNKTALGETMLPPGEYEARLILGDGYEVLAAKRFRVVP